MTSTARIEERSAQAYLGKRTIMPMSEFETAVPAMMQQVAAEAEGQDARPFGRPFLRYHVIDMPKRMDVEVGWPVEGDPASSGDFTTGSLPAGRYAVLSYTGVRNGIDANAKLVAWIEAQGEAAAHRKVAEGDAFDARLETFLTNADVEPDQGKWETEVAIKLRD